MAYHLFNNVFDHIFILLLRITTFQHYTVGGAGGSCVLVNEIVPNLRRYLGLDRDYVPSRTVHLL